MNGSPAFLLEDLPNDESTISRIHVIDAEFQAGVKCTFSGYYSDWDFDFPIEISCVIKGEMTFCWWNLDYCDCLVEMLIFILYLIMSQGAASYTI